VFLLLIAVTTVILDIGVRGAWERSLREEIEASLAQKVRMLALSVPPIGDCGFSESRLASLLPLAKIQAQAAQARVTIIDSCGNVLADSEADARTMETHRERPEFATALQGMRGRDTRSSHTVGVEFLYTAVPIGGGAVRLAYPLTEVRERT